MKASRLSRLSRLAASVLLAIIGILAGADMQSAFGQGALLQANAPAADAPVLTLDPGTHTAAIRQLAVDASRRIIVTASDDKTARIWDLASGRLRGTLHPPVGADNIGRLYAVASSPEGTVAIGGTTRGNDGRHRIYFYDGSSQRFIKAVDARGGDIKRLAYSPDGQWLAAAYAGDGAVRIFNRRGDIVYEERLAADAWCLAFAADGRLAVAVSDGSVRLYGIAGSGSGSAAGSVRASDVALLATLKASLVDPRGLAFSPDGRWLAVGYLSRSDNNHKAQIDVFDLQSQLLARAFQFDDIKHGNLRNVAWSADGRSLYAGGTGYTNANNFIVKRIAWPEGRADTIPAAGNSITDLVPLPDNSVVFATVEASWGTLREETARTRVAARSAQFSDSRALSISDDASLVAWRLASGGKTVRFSLNNRILLEGQGNAERTGNPSNNKLQVRDWENQFRASVNGTPVRMAPSEISRAAAVLPDDSAVILATSRSLRRIDRNGQESWSVPLATEARAVSVSADGRVLVAALADGTLRWRRTNDGAPLMSLFALPEGQWILWTEQGYFDAGMNSEELAGWTVNRADGTQADYFPMSRFRERYFRPDVLDHMLATADIGAAVAAADAQRREMAAAAEESTRQQVAQLLQPAPVQKSLPPVVSLLSPATIESSDGNVAVDYKLYIPGGGASSQVTARIDGRPLDISIESGPGIAPAQGEITGRMRMKLPERDAVVQLFATNANGTSAPASLQYRYQPPRIEEQPPKPIQQAPEVQLAQNTEAIKQPERTPPTPERTSESAPASAPTQHTGNEEPRASSLDKTARKGSETPYEKRPKLYLLAIGINEFANARINLVLAGKDASDFSKVLLKQEKVFYDAVESRVLSNQAATREAILRNLEWLKSAPGPDDVGVLFIAGHGVNDADDIYYYLPHDVDVKRLASTGVSESVFRDVLANMRGKTLFFVDTCYSGKSLGTLSRTDLTRMANKFSSPEHGVIVFSASHGRQQSLESPDWGNGAFTKVLISGISGAADYRKQGLITHRGLDYYLGYEVPALTRGMQTPVTMVPTGIADFAIAKGQSGAKPDSGRP